MNKIIMTEKLTKRFGTNTAVDNLTMEVEKGEVIGLLGPNGAGKTTTIRMLSGMIAPTSGKAKVLGFSVPAEIYNVHEKIGLLTETPGLYENLSAEYNLRYFAGFYENLDPDRQVEKYLKLTGLYERRKEKAGRFSKGMKQRLAIARSLLNEPELLFLDEPTSGLDPEAAADIRELIRLLKTEGRTIILSTHNLDEAMKLSDRIAILKTSLLVYDTPHNLINSVDRRTVVIKCSDILKCLSVLRTADGVMSAEQKDHIVEVEVSKTTATDQILKMLMNAGIDVSQIFDKERTLEELYLSMMKKDVANV